jgi:transposase-like protein
MNTGSNLYYHHRFPSEIISHCVWLYFRFRLSYRDVEELMVVRGVTLTYETVRQWCGKFDQIFANDLRRRRPRPGDKSHLDEIRLLLSVRTVKSRSWFAMVMLPMVNRIITVIVAAETPAKIQAAIATLSRDMRSLCGRISSEAPCGG